MRFEQKKQKQVQLKLTISHAVELFLHCSSLIFLDSIYRFWGCHNMNMKYALCSIRLIRYNRWNKVRHRCHRPGNSCSAQLCFPQVGSHHSFGVCALQVALCHHGLPAYPASSHFIGLLSIGTHITWQTWATGAEHMAPITLIVGEHWRDQPEDKEAIHGRETDSLAALWQFKKNQTNSSVHIRTTILQYLSHNLQ